MPNIILEWSDMANPVYENLDLSEGDDVVYGDHHVICYAYTRLVSSTDGSYVTYLKVADGWSTSPRYIDLSSVGDSKYWEAHY